MVRGLGISKQDVLDAAILFAGTKNTFTAREFTEFLKVQAYGAEEEEVDELLAEFADKGELRQIGPGVYARPRVKLRAVK